MNPFIFAIWHSTYLSMRYDVACQPKNRFLKRSWVVASASDGGSRPKPCASTFNCAGWRQATRRLRTGGLKEGGLCVGNKQTHMRREMRSEESDPVNETIFPRPRSRAETDARYY